MSDLHIDDFYKDVGLIFLRLYNSFPRKIILYVEDICGADRPDEFGLHSERFLSGFSAMVWLGDHGYLTYASPIKQEALDQVVLSERGFLLLSSRSEIDFGDPFQDKQHAAHASPSEALPPSVMEHSKTNISQLRKAINSGSSIMISQCLQYMLSSRT
ncbi:MAG: hypothetical protein WCY88_08995 [Spongiibacteraceae bacterium]